MPIYIISCAPCSFSWRESTYSRTQSVAWMVPKNFDFAIDTIKRKDGWDLWWRGQPERRGGPIRPYHLLESGAVPKAHRPNLARFHAVYGMHVFWLRDAKKIEVDAARAKLDAQYRIDTLATATEVLRNCVSFCFVRDGRAVHNSDWALVGPGPR